MPSNSTGPRERPILMSAPMVRAILDGRKTQTRRIVTGRWLPIVDECLRVNGKWVFDTVDYELTTPYGRPGDSLWVKETWQEIPDDGGTIVYRATDPDWETTDEWKWRPSIFMRREYSRITLENTGVRVERLQDISHRDALAEGVDYNVSDPDGSPLCRYRKLWVSINGKGSWAKNPLVWAISFRRLDAK